MVEVSDLKVLVIAPRFFGYEHDIVAELEGRGMSVDLLQDRPFDSPFLKAVMRFRPELGGYQAADRYFFESLQALCRSNYDMILVIQGEGVSARTLTMLRAEYPKARMVFYTWDSIENKPFSKTNLESYDRCSTFDPVDAKNYGMVFRPLFFSPGFDRHAEPNYNYDISFVGTVHSDRYRIIKKITEQLPLDTRRYIYLYLQAPWMFDVRRLFTRTIIGSKRNEFRSDPLSRESVQKVFFGSRVIIDIEHPSQRGATMRTFETLGSNRKMITTNLSLRNYDFYDPCNILIIDRKNPVVPHDFLGAPYSRVPQEVRARYSIKNWVDEVCDI